MDSVLVTGGAGYIGSHTCKCLAKAGFLPITYDNLSTGHEYAVKWGPFIRGDLSDAARLNSAIAEFKPKAVLHFAASAIVFESVQDPAKYYENNVGSAIHLLNAMRQNGIKDLIFSSTCATYGIPQSIPIIETHPQDPINPYGRSKLMIEQMIRDYSHSYGLRSINLRYFNVAGADPDLEIGENHDPETHLIPSILHAVLGIQPEAIVYGTDFESKDGSAIRDYIHVQDLAEAHVLALKYLLTEQKSDVINLGTTNGFSVFEIIESIEKYTGKKVPIKLEKRRPGDPSILVADRQKAEKVLGWTPKLSDLATIIDTAWKWQQLLHENVPLLKSAIKKIDSSC
ncbi:MAG: UDP-glucose 4-epimerase GalE [Chlamydiae bacterium RIFCSPHIGHO2_12_FULL_49_9]|nr:MAG: UDP-glucose 4-epimerase GalE [Chlamydiae bacterium RIFCSPHIGHO2_12_FULL_49_9]